MSVRNTRARATARQATDSGLQTNSVEVPTRRILDAPESPDPTGTRDTDQMSLRSARSTSSFVARRRAVEFRIAKQRARIHEELLNKQMDAELAQIDAEEEENQPNMRIDTDIAASTERVHQWLDKQDAATVRSNSSYRHIETNARRISKAPPPERAASPPRTTHDEVTRAMSKMHVDEVGHAPICTASNGWRARMIDLPIFDGANPTDWLAFRAAYQQTNAMHKFSSIENMARLRIALKGRAKETVAAQLFTGSDPDLIMEDLDLRFNRPDVLLRNEIEAVRRVAEGDIFEFASRINNAVHSLTAIGELHYLHSPELLAAVYEKLSPTLQRSWAQHAYEHGRHRATLKEMADFLKKEAIMTRAAPGAVSMETPKPAAKGRKRTTEMHVHATVTETCTVCDEAHNLTACSKFASMSLTSRWTHVKKNKFCFRCLASKHRRDDCRVKNCGVNGCRYPHHRLLHEDRKPAAPITQPTPEQPETTPSTSRATFSCNATIDQRAYLKMVPVTIYGPHGQADIFAMLDEGSTVTIIEEAVTKEVGARGQSTSISLATLGGNTTVNSETVTVSLRGPNGKRHQLRGRTVPELNITTQSVNKTDVGKYTHLSQLTEKLCYNEARPKLLIGQDQWHLIVSKETRHGKRNEPVASRTELGWVLHGCMTTGTNVMRHPICHVTMDPLLEEVRRYFELESVGIVPRVKHSTAELKALQLLEERTSQDQSGRYWVPLLWNADKPAMPCNREAAMKRLRSLEKRMDIDPIFADQYITKMEEVIKKGYAEIHNDSVDEPGWHLPHFGVYNPNKPGKLRIVYDAAARTHGVCLNDRLLGGPDLLQSLPRILFRFREGKVAFTGDIREMFSQIKIVKEHQQYQKFLWRGRNRTTEPQTYKMSSMIFGAVSSPFTALFIKNRNAEKFSETYPEAVRIITEDHYMDDCISSTNSHELASKLIQQVTYIHEQAHFEIRDWACNDERVMATVPIEKRSNATVTLTMDQSTVKTLGLLWDTTTDVIKFAVAINRVPPEVKKGLCNPTKRQMLSVLMSLYDPQGFATPFIVRGRILLQKIWRSGIAWDEELRGDEQVEWRKWIAGLDDLRHISIPRWYKTTDEDCFTELHVFVDASELAYCAVAYFNYRYANGVVHTSIVASKARVAPIKPVTIPRLELQAALMGARLASFIKESHRGKIDARYMWTDSRTVHSWIRSDARAYKPFVAHRIAEITDLTDPSEWLWIPTKHNVADDATRQDCTNLNNNHRWFKGPEFLRQAERPWTQPPDLKNQTDEEKKKIVMATTLTEQSVAPHLPDPSRFSSFIKLERTTARVLQFIEKIKTPLQAREGVTPKSLHSRHLQMARQLLLREAQINSFPREWSCLQRQQPIPKDSPLARLDIHIGNDNVIRLNGRIRRATFAEEDTRSPIVLHGSHPIVTLLVKSYHQKFLHANNETVVNELRQKYFILRLRPTVRSVAAKCQLCRLRRANPTTPPMGDLPLERLGNQLRAFTYSGLDYMGPVEVTIGRRREKRYIALFTCLTIRAIHLELVHSLTTDSAIMAVRRFIARRGCPTTILSDNGTCFRGAATELHRARAELDLSRLEEFAQIKGFVWKFLPPASPAMGGAWERLVRSVKVALKTTLNERAPKEEILLTVMAEAESIINSRPLTHVPIEADDPEALTPNHLLLGSSSGAPTPGVFSNDDLVRRRAWRSSQRLADIFWQRWRREYLPTLAPRPSSDQRNQDLRVGDLVYVTEPNLPRNTWLRAKVEAVHPGADGRIRVADVRTRGGQLRRPVRRLARIQMEDNAEPSPANKECDELAPHTEGAV